MRRRFEAFSLVQGCLDEVVVVVGIGHQGPGGVLPCEYPIRSDRTILLVTCGIERVEGRVGPVVAARHVEPRENFPLRQRAPVQPRDMLERPLEQVEAFTGVGESRARVELADQRRAVDHRIGRGDLPVRQSGGVVEHHPRGDAVGGRVGFRPVRVPVVPERCIQIHPALVDQPERDVGAHHLGKGGSLEHRLAGDSTAGLVAHHAMDVCVVHAVVGMDQLGAGNGVAPHDFVEPGRARRCRCVAALRDIRIGRLWVGPGRARGRQGNRKNGGAQYVLTHLSPG